MARTRKTPARKEPAKRATAAVSKKKAATKDKHALTGRGKGRGKGKAKETTKPSSTNLTPATNTFAPDFIVRGTTDRALFTLTCYRGEGMCLLAMNWKQDTPPDSFVGFAIEYMEPGGSQFYALRNRIAFPDASGQLNPNTLSSRFSPFQKFRWTHFPTNASTPGNFTYRVTSVFMDQKGIISYGDFQEAGIELEAETYPGELNICFTRGFISSQAFVDRFGTNGGVGTLLPKTANAGITFKSTDPKEETALAWMGFEARSAILNTLDAAIADSTAQVCVAAYDFNDPEIVSRLEQLKGRLKIIIDDSGSHQPATASETKAAAMLADSAGAGNIQRQHMGGLQHNKLIVVDGDKTKIAIGGSTNFSWRGLYVQNNNAVVVQGANVVKIFSDAFNNLWASPDSPPEFDSTTSADWNNLGFTNVDAQVTFSPHSIHNAKLQEIANDISSTESSLLYSLAFLYETKGAILDAITKVTSEDNVFVYGLSDKTVGGLNVQLPNGNPPVAFPAALLKDVPPPFSQEATGGSGTRLHHKFVVIDFNKPTARVYTGSYNFSVAADTKNAENLFVIRDQRIATSYMVEAVSMFDHYVFRDSEAKATAAQPLELRKPPADGSGDKPWWDKYWTDPQEERDRELFGQ
jgi:phosphatidylserine/phosphatidylglycerophosphate/cardiolipin synthase-like enzyme